MKSKVPRGVPGILPLVGHGDNVGVVEMLPLTIAAKLSPRGWSGGVRIASEPLLHDVVVELLRPEHSSEPLAHDVLRVCGEIVWNHCSVERVSGGNPLGKDFIDRMGGVFGGE